MKAFKSRLWGCAPSALLCSRLVPSKIEVGTCAPARNRRREYKERKQKKNGFRGRTQLGVWTNLCNMQLDYNFDTLRIVKHYEIFYKTLNCNHESRFILLYIAESVWYLIHFFENTGGIHRKDYTRFRK